jgi:hypothetical protein
MKTGREIMMDSSPQELRAYRLRQWEKAVEAAIKGAAARDIPALAARAIDDSIKDSLIMAQEANAFAAALAVYSAPPEQPDPQAGE